MIGIVITTHGDLAKEFYAALVHIRGPQEQMACVAIGPQDDPEECREQVRAAVESVDSGEGVVILTDMFGGTPSNLSISLMKRPSTEVIAGINLPLLVKLCEIRGRKPIKEVCDLAQEAGRKYITVASTLLNVSDD